MISDKFITREEMKEISALMEILDEFLRAERTCHVGVALFTDEVGMGEPLPVMDPNGDILGYVGLGEELDKTVFWLDNGEDAK